MASAKEKERKLLLQQSGVNSGGEVNDITAPPAFSFKSPLQSAYDAVLKSREKKEGEKEEQSSMFARMQDFSQTPAEDFDESAWLKGQYTEAGSTTGETNKLLTPPTTKPPAAAPPTSSFFSDLKGSLFKGTRTTPPTTPDPTPAPAPVAEVGEPTGDLSAEEAAENVKFQRDHGTGLDAHEAMQEPNYKIGSVGLGKARPVNEATRKSSQYRKASRRLDRAGKGAAAERMALLGELERMGEPVIDTEELRAQRAAMKMASGGEAKQQDEEDAADRKKREARGMAALDEREASHNAQVGRDRKKASDDDEKDDRDRARLAALLKRGDPNNRTT